MGIKAVSVYALQYRLGRLPMMTGHPLSAVSTCFGLAVEYASLLSEVVEGQIVGPRPGPGSLYTLCVARSEGLHGCRVATTADQLSGQLLDGPGGIG